MFEEARIAEIKAEEEAREMDRRAALKRLVTANTDAERAAASAEYQAVLERAPGVP